MILWPLRSPTSEAVGFEAAGSSGRSITQRPQQYVLLKKKKKKTVLLSHQRTCSRPPPRGPCAIRRLLDHARPWRQRTGDRQGFRRLDWEPDREPRALTRSALHRDRTAVELGEQLDHRQTQTGALELPSQAAVDLTERLEQLRQSPREMPMPLSVTQISRKSVNSLSANGKLRPAQAPGHVPTSPRGHRRARSVTRPPRR